MFAAARLQIHVLHLAALVLCSLRAIVPAAAQFQQVLQQQFNGDMASPSHIQQQALQMDLQLEHNSQV